MFEPRSFETLVVGVGNTILSDDGVGVHAARLLMSDPRVHPDIGILDGGTLGLELLAHIADASRILFLDAIRSGASPGTLVRLTGEELLDRKIGWSVHQLGVADLIAALTLMSDRNPEIVVLGLEPESTDWGTSLTPAVQSGLASLVDSAVSQLGIWEGRSDSPGSGRCNAEVSAIRSGCEYFDTHPRETRH